MGRTNFIVSWDVHEKSFITSGPGWICPERFYHIFFQRNPEKNHIRKEGKESDYSGWDLSHHFDPESKSKVQGMQWKHQGWPPPKKFKQHRQGSLWHRLSGTHVRQSSKRTHHHWAALCWSIKEPEWEYQRKTKMSYPFATG